MRPLFADTLPPWLISERHFRRRFQLSFYIADTLYYAFSWPLLAAAAISFQAIAYCHFRHCHFH
jgi:hypothetical protein